MPYRIVPFETLGIYHVYNRGVEKRQVFSSDRDYQRFLQTIYYYQFSGPKPKFSNQDRFRTKDFDQGPKIVEIICYCLMPNHFHLLIRQNKEDGIKEFISKVLNSYTKYFNTKNKRVGPLFQGTFKAVPTETDLQLMHVSRYIHLNPYTSGLTKDLNGYLYSSFVDYAGISDHSICNKEPVLTFFKGPKDYEEFVVGHSAYARELEIMKHLLLEKE